MSRYPSPLLRLSGLPQIRQSSLPEGQQGNLDTINFMIRVARLRASDPLPRKLALNILSDYQVPSNNFADESLAIGDYIKNNVRYVRDPDGIEYLQDPVDLINTMATAAQTGNLAQGDCDDMALLIATLLLSIGHTPYYRAVRYKADSGHYNHIYVVDYDRNQGSGKMRIVLDAIMKQYPIGYEVPSQSGDEFEI